MSHDVFILVTQHLVSLLGYVGTWSSLTATGTGTGKKMQQFSNNIMGSREFHFYIPLGRRLNKYNLACVHFFEWRGRMHRLLNITWPQNNFGVAWHKPSTLFTTYCVWETLVNLFKNIFCKFFRNSVFWVKLAQYIFLRKYACSDQVDVGETPPG